MIKTAIITEELCLDRVQGLLRDVTEIRVAPAFTQEEVIRHAKDAQVLIALYEPLTAHVLHSLPSLQYIALLSIGTNTVDLSAAKALGIRVSNNPFYCREEVADHTCAFILSLTRQLPWYDRRIREEGRWEYANLAYPLRRLSSLTIGLAGFGSIARGVASRMSAFGSKIIAYDPYVPAEIAEAVGVTMVSMQTLLADSDVLCVHMPLTSETKALFGQEAFAQMKPSAIFINCARGEVVDEDALAQALQNGTIQSAGIDVLSEEYPDLQTLPLLKQKNLLLTPHAAFYSQESFEEADTQVATYVKKFVAGDLAGIPFVV